MQTINKDRFIYTFTSVYLREDNGLVFVALSNKEHLLDERERARARHEREKIESRETRWSM